MEIIIELPGEPKGKGRPRFAKGQVYTPSDTHSYETHLGWAGAAAMAGLRPLEGPLKVEIEARFSIPKSWSRQKQERAIKGGIFPTSKPDADNIMKMLDALNGIVWLDDAQIVTATIWKWYSDKPGLIVRVSKETTDCVEPV